MHTTLLDTDILSEVLKQRNSAVVQRAKAYLAQYGALSFSAVTRYEVMRGPKEKNATALLPRFDAICQYSFVLPVDEAVFDSAADLWVAARRGGHPVGDADLLIAATALVNNCVLTTGNIAHFSWVSQLSIEDWRI